MEETAEEPVDNPVDIAVENSGDNYADAGEFTLILHPLAYGRWCTVDPSSLVSNSNFLSSVGIQDHFGLYGS